MPEAAAYFVNSTLGVVLSNPAVDGTHTDDREGLPNEHPTVAAQLNMSAADMAQLEFATQASTQYLAAALAANNKTCTDCLAGAYLNSFPQPHPGQGCIPAMRKLCTPGAQGASMYFELDTASANQTVAAFLVARSPLAYIGFQQGSSDADWNPLFELDVGSPLGLCEEEAGTPGVFSRAWTNGVVSLDCNDWSASLPFPSKA